MERFASNGRRRLADDVCPIEGRCTRAARGEGESEEVRANSGLLLDAHTGPLWWRGYARPERAGLTEDESCAELRAAVQRHAAPLPAKPKPKKGTSAR